MTASARGGYLPWADVPCVGVALHNLGSGLDAVVHAAVDAITLAWPMTFPMPARSRGSISEYNEPREFGQSIVRSPIIRSIQLRR